MADNIVSTLSEQLSNAKPELFTGWSPEEVRAEVENYLSEPEKRVQLAPLLTSTPTFQGFSNDEVLADLNKYIPLEKKESFSDKFKRMGKTFVNSAKNIPQDIAGAVDIATSSSIGTDFITPNVRFNPTTKSVLQQVGRGAINLGKGAVGVFDGSPAQGYTNQDYIPTESMPSDRTSTIIPQPQETTAIAQRPAMLTEQGANVSLGQNVPKNAPMRAVANVDDEIAQQEYIEPKRQTLVEKTKGAYELGKKSTSIGDAGFDFLMGNASAEDVIAVSQESMAEIPEQDQREPFIHKVITGVAQLTPFIGEVTTEGAKWGAGAAAIESAKAFATKGVSAFHGALLVGGAFKTGTTKRLLEISSGMIAAEMLNAGIDPDVVKKVAPAVSVPYVLSESLNLSRMLPRKGLVGNTIVSTVIKNLKAKGGDITENILQEALQRGMEMGAVTFGKMVDQKTKNPDLSKSLGDLVGGMMQEAVGVAPAMIGVGALGVAGSTVRAVPKMGDIYLSKKIQEEIDKSIKNSIPEDETFESVLKKAGLIEEETVETGQKTEPEAEPQAEQETGQQAEQHQEQQEDDSFDFGKNVESEKPDVEPEPFDEPYNQPAKPPEQETVTPPKEPPARKEYADIELEVDKEKGVPNVDNWETLPSGVKKAYISDYHTKPDGMGWGEWNNMLPNEREELLENIEDFKTETKAESEKYADEDPLNIRDNTITETLTNLTTPVSRLNRKTGKLTILDGIGMGVNSKEYADLLNPGVPFENLTNRAKTYLTDLMRTIETDSDLKEQWGGEEHAPKHMDDLRDLLSNGVTKAQKRRGETAFYSESKPNQGFESKKETPKEEDYSTKSEKETPKEEKPPKQESQYPNPYDMRNYQPGKKVPLVAKSADIGKIVEALYQGKAPKLVEVIARRRSVKGAVYIDKKTGKTNLMKLRRDLWRGDLVADFNPKETTVDDAINEVATKFNIDPRNLNATISGRGKNKRVMVYKNNPKLAGEVVAHELGHILRQINLDLDKGTAKEYAKSNLLGYMLNIANFTEEYAAGVEGGKSDFTDAEIAEYKRQAEQLVGEEESPLVDEEITTTLDVTPETITGILGRSVEDMRKKYPKLYATIARMTSAEKKQLALNAIRKGITPDELKKMVGEETIKTGRKVRSNVKLSKAEIKEKIEKKFDRLFKDALVEHGILQNKVIRDELKDLTQIVKPFDTSEDKAFTRYRHNKEELWADAISVLLNDPKLFMAAAPTFARGLFNYGAKREAFKTAWEGLQKEIGEKSYGKRVTETLDKMFGEFEKKRLEQEKKDENKYALKFSSIWADLDQKLIEKNRAVLKLRKMLKKRGLLINADNDIETKLDEFAYSSSEVTVYMGRQSENLDRLTKLGIDYEDLQKMAFVDRVEFERQYLANPKMVDVEGAREARKELYQKYGDKKYNDLVDIINTFRENRQSVIKKLIRSGQLNKVQAKYFKDNSVYVTFSALKDIDNSGGGSAIGKFYRQFGGLGSIEDPIFATLMTDAGILKSVNRKSAFDSYKSMVYDAIKQEILPDDYIQPASTLRGANGETRVLPPKNSALGVVKVEEFGKTVGYYIPKSDAESFNKESNSENHLMNAIGALTGISRALYVTKNLGFMVGNILRDYEATKVLLPGNNVPLQHLTTLLPEYFKSVNTAWDYAKRGKMSDEIKEMFERKMLLSVTSRMGLDTEERAVERMFDRWNARGEYNKKAVIPGTQLLRFLDALSTTTEMTSKVAAKRYLEKHTNLSKTQVEDYVRNYAGTPNPLKGGQWRTGLNNVALFAPVAIQGYKRLGRRIADEPLTGLKLLASAVAPKLFMYGLMYASKNIRPNKNDSKKMKHFKANLGYIGDVLRRVSEYDIANYTIIPIGKTKKGADLILRLPVDESSRVVGGSVVKMLENGMSLGLVKNIFEYSAGQLPGLSPVLGLTKDTYGMLFGEHSPYNAYYGRPAISEEEWTAGGWDKFGAGFAYIWNRYGGRTIANIPTKDIENADGFLNKYVSVSPFGSVIKRFVKEVGVQGIEERVERDVLKPIEKVNAKRNIMLTKETAKMLKRFDSGESPTEKDVEELWVKIMGKDPKKNGRFMISYTKFRNRYMKLYVKRFGDAMHVAASYSASLGTETKNAWKKKWVSELKRRGLSKKEVEKEIEKYYSLTTIYSDIYESINKGKP